MAEEGTGQSLPNYRWVVKEQRVILAAKEVGEDESKAVYPEGLTRAENGDLLLAACCPAAEKTSIMRSADGGYTWSPQGVLPHQQPEEYSGRWGFVEGMTALRSGRLVIIYYILDQETVRTDPGYEYYVPGGNNFRFVRSRSVQWGACSDDEGKTWRYTPMDISPFLSADFEASSQIFETENGTLAASFRAHLNQAELDSGITSNGVIRSHDGGLTWGDASIIHKAVPGSALWYNESQVAPLPDGRWLCMMRLNDNNVHPKSPLTMCRSYSRDRGYTWTHPVRTRFHGGEPGMGMLPDGAILCTQTGGRFIDQVIKEDGTTTRRFGPEERGKLVYEISCDNGLTWAYWGDLYVTEPFSEEHIGSPIIRPLDHETAIAVYHRGTRELAEKYPGRGPQIIGASWLRKAPADDPEAADLRYPKD